MTTKSPASVQHILPRKVVALVSGVTVKDRHPGLQLDKLSAPGKQEHQLAAVTRVCEAAGDERLLRELHTRRDKTLTYARASRFRATTTGPLTLHLARASALENAGLHLHPVYGFVCLPGSGLKGVARSYAETVWLPDQTDASASWNDIRTVFGWAPNSESAKSWRPPELEDADGSSAGAVAFHDAWPVTWPRLEPDIVNNHHSKYYAGDDEPGDWDEPTMAFFLSVRPGTTFDFAVSVRPGIDDSLRTLACTWLQAAIVHNGVGAKTNAGYGRFRLENVVLPTVPDVARRVSTHTLKLVTPAFLAGAKRKREDCDLRPATLRGVLRWWWRTMHARHLDRESLRRLEAAIWGDTEAGGALALSIQGLGAVDPHQFGKKEVVRRHCHGERGLEYLAYGMDENKGRRWYLSSESWEATLTASRACIEGSRIEITADDVLRQGEAALWLLCRYGGVGSKARKGFGSLADVETKDITSVHDCKEIAAKIRGVARLRGAHGAVASSSLDDMLRRDLLTPWRDSWFSLSQLGGAIQRFASSNSHREHKRALGLPRKIHGPTSRPMRHQNSASHRPPKSLSVERGRRFAAPVHYHYARENDGTLTLRITAFPSPELPDDKTSRNVLNDIMSHLRKDIEQRTRRHSGQGSKQLAERTSPPITDEGRRHVPRVGEEVSATLLPQKTRKGGWKAVHDASGLQGPIQNTHDVPGDAAPGAGVSLIVQYANDRDIGFRWPLRSDQAGAPADRKTQPADNASRKPRRRTRQP